MIIMTMFVGGPGSGKGTNCQKIVDSYGYKHLSAGDLLRDERQSGSALADMINTYIKEGKIVPAEVTVGLLRAAMDTSDCEKFLIDGFPRDMVISIHYQCTLYCLYNWTACAQDNLRCWEKEMNGVADVQFLLFLDCPQEIMLGRLLER
jgi:UMP-CMP kinase